MPIQDICQVFTVAKNQPISPYFVDSGLKKQDIGEQLKVSPYPA
jgi:hypothetical protein